MTKKEIEIYLQANYKLCPPINHLLKVFYTDRWLRIHSLPDSKRYAETDEEWETLYNTQNTILNDIFKEDEIFYLFVGIYSSSSKSIVEDPAIDNEHLYKYNFTALNTIDLYAMTKEYYDEDTFYTPYYTELNYKAGQYNEILKSIANDELRAFFLNPVTKTIFAPYDGGIDIIYSDTAAKDKYKIKYSLYTQQDQYK
jgi:hypothetical protein